MPPIYIEPPQDPLPTQAASPETLEPLNIPKSDLIFAIRKLTRAQTIKVLGAAGIETVRLKADLRVNLRSGVPDQFGKDSMAKQGEPYEDAPFDMMVSHPLLKHILVEALDNPSKIQAITHKIVLIVAELLADTELSLLQQRPPTPEARQAEREATNTRVHEELVAAIKANPKHFKTKVQELIASKQL